MGNADGYEFLLSSWLVLFCSAPDVGVLDFIRRCFQQL